MLGPWRGDLRLVGLALIWWAGYFIMWMRLGISECRLHMGLKMKSLYLYLCLYTLLMGK